MAGGRVTLLEHEPASARLRTGGPLKVRFQLEATEFDGRWVPILGFSIADSDRSNELQVDFAEAPGYERLVLAATSINRAEKKREPLTQVMVPHFSVRDVHEFELIIDPSSATIVIHGQRRAFTLAHRADRLIVRPSGVKGWIEFPDPAFA